jgi:DNA replication protein DnaC
MEIIEDRYGRGSTLITSQLPVEAWHDVIGEPTFADATWIADPERQLSLDSCDQ